MLGGDTVVSLVLIALFLLVAASGIKIVPQSHEYVVEQFGKYTTTLKAGLNFIVPFLNRVVHKVSILERQLEPQQISRSQRDSSACASPSAGGRSSPNSSRTSASDPGFAGSIVIASCRMPYGSTKPWGASARWR